MFSQNESGRISDEYVAVKLTGGVDITPEVTDFMSRYGVRGYPTLLVMNADGHVVNNRVGRTTDQIMGAIAQGEANEASFAKIEAAAKAEGADQVATDAYLGALEDRMAWDTLLVHLEAAPRAADRDTKLAGVYAKLGRSEDELKLLGEMVSAYPDADERPDWRMRLAMSEMDGVKDVESLKAIFPGVIGKLEALTKAAGEEGDTATATKADVQALWLSVILGFRTENYVDCKAAIDQMIAKYPTEQLTQQAKRALPQVEAKLAEAEGGSTE